MPRPTDPGAGFLSSPRVRGWLFGFCLVAATLMAYRPAWQAGFIWDDDTYVRENTLLTAPDGLRRIWFSLDSPSQYFPLTFTTFYFERALWGLNPAGYHWVNFLLHAANALLVWRLLARLGVPGAWLAAAIFALHPVQVESVAWITERKNVLMGVFFLLTVWTWINFIDAQTRRPWRFYVAGLVFYALALSAKTTACTLPAALLLILWLKKMPVTRRRLGQIAPFVAMGVGMGLVTVWWERFHQGTQGRVFAIGPVERVLIATRAVWFYAGKLLWPANLTFSYPRWTISASDPRAYVWMVAAAALGVVIWRARRWAGRSVEVAAAFFVATLSPMLGFIMLFTFLYTFVADHYQYLACIGPMALAAAGMEMGLGRLPWGKALLLPALSVALLLLTLGTLTWRQCGMYTNMETLWRTTIARNPDCWLAENDLGVMLYDKGRVDEAVTLYRSSLAIRPDQAETHNNLGAALDKKGQLDDAVIEFQKALVLRPNFAEARRNLGDILLRKGRVDEAVLQFQEAVALRPDIAKARYNLADALFRKGRVDEAILQLQAAVELHPDDDKAHYDLGVTLLQYGRRDEAILQFQKALALRPGFAGAENNLGYCLLQKGRADEAVAHFNKALEIRPDYPEAHYNLGRALLQTGQADGAIVQFQKLLAIQPESAQGRINLAGIAWRLATSPNPALRNGIKAIELARQTDELAGGGDPGMAAILAAAYAEAGQFEKAVATAQRAVQLATRQNNAAMVATIQAQLHCYENGSPFRDKGATP